MIRDAILKTKRDELTKCITSRKRKLQELYHATVSFARTESLASQRQLDVDEWSYTTGQRTFLGANNILQGRYFDSKTLLLPYGSDLNDHNGSTISHSAPSSRAEKLHNKETLSTGGKKLELETDDHRTIEGQDKPIDSNDTTNSVSTIPTSRNKYSDTTCRSSKGAQTDPYPELHTTRETNIRRNQEVLEEEPNNEVAGKAKTTPRLGIVEAEDISRIAPSQASQLTIVDTDTMFRPDTLLASANARSGPARTIHLPFMDHLEHDMQRQKDKAKDDLTGLQDSVGKFGHKDNSSSSQTRFDEQQITQLGDVDGYEIHTAGQPIDICSKDRKVIQDLPNTDFEKRENQVSGTPRQDSILKSQMDVTRDNVFRGDRSTPDAQLRLEEAQFMKPFTKQRNDAVPGSKRDLLQPGQHASGLIPQLLHNQTELNQVNGSAFNTDSSILRPTSSDNREIDRSVSQRTPSSQRLKHPGMTRDLSRDLMFSQRPPMRIEIGACSRDELSLVTKTTPYEGTLASTLPSNIAPTNSTPTKASAHSTPLERMTTRVSSGALRHKSVSEILGETPRIASLGDKTPNDTGGHFSGRDIVDSQTLKSASLVMSPESLHFRSRLSELREREKERNKLSTVVFTRQQSSTNFHDLGSSTHHQVDIENSSSESKDYLISLFATQASTPPRSQALNKLLSSAHKTLTTSNHYLDFHEQQDGRILRRIYHLQESNRWSLRQIERPTEPERPRTHWDEVIGHVRWMRSDFREERKWKLATAKNLADWCAEWVVSLPEKRILLQVKTRTVNMGQNVTSVSTPDLIPSAGDDSSDAMDEDTPPAFITKLNIPAAMFSLAPDDVLFALERTPVSDKLLSELPIYQPRIESRDSSQPTTEASLDRAWKCSIVPISRFALGKMVVREQGPMRKKSRYNYADDNDTELSRAYRIYLTTENAADAVTPEQDNVALFNPENKHIRDRIHAGHAFRPPSEYNMPSQKFFESRQSSQWTWGEDDELRKLVREFAYNWSLISSCLSSPSIFSSGAERRTPWECFERWVSLEGLPADMSKTQYFRAYHSRLEAAQRTLMAQQQAALQQQVNNASQIPVRRRTALPVRVDRRKNNKHLALVHAMQKLARKRETAVQKQQHVASLAAMRKANEAAQPKAQMQTPQEFSRFKYERECKMAERAEVYRQQILAQQRAAFQQKTNLQSGQQAIVVAPVLAVANNTSQLSRAPTSSANPVANPGFVSSLSNGQLHAVHQNSNRPVPPSQPIMNGIHVNGSVPPNVQTGVRGGVVPQAQMQSHMQGQQHMPQHLGSDNIRIYMEANRVQQEQQRYLQQQRQQQHPQINGQTINSPPSNNATSLSQNNSAMLANLQATNGIASPSINAPVSGPRSSASPRITNSLQPQPLSSGMVPAVNQISNQIKARNPQASPEQVSKMTTETLNSYRMFQAQAAMSAAAGTIPTAGAGSAAGLQLPTQQQAMMNGVNGASSMNSQLYAQMMRSQQSSQSRNSGSGINVVGPPNKGATPQIHRAGSGQAGSSQSPRLPQAQMAGAQ